jgi:DNA-binding transcriptional regulator YiaG
MKPELKARLERLGPVRDIVRVASGSPVNLILRLQTDLRATNSIDAVHALAYRGMTLLRAKRAVEAVIEVGEALVHVPTVEDMAAFADALRTAGFKVVLISDERVDVKSVRARLELTQEQFALRFGLDIDAVQNWEQGRCQPDRATASYLRVIDREPKMAAAALETVIG